MQKIARQFDLCYLTCYQHKRPVTGNGYILVGSSNTVANTLPVARVGDAVMGPCGIHTGVITSGSPNVRVNSIAVARVGDTVGGGVTGTITGGSPDVFAN